MAFCTPEELVEARKKNPNLTIYTGHYNEVERGPMTVEQAKKSLDACLKLALNRQQGNKLNRPWAIVDFTKKLDPAQAWLGFEFEMGLPDQAAYNRLITYVWHEHNHVAVDLEGYGQWSPEITFAPENASAFVNGTSGIQRLIKWMNDEKVKMVDFGEHRVGQHVNISVPATRGNTVANNQISLLINHSLWLMSERALSTIFGRMPYGLSRPRVAGATNYIEFKVFKATDDVDRFNEYAQVSTRLADVIQHLSTNREWVGRAYDAYNGTQHIANLYDILIGRVPANEAVVGVLNGQSAQAAIQSGSGWRYRNGLSRAPIV